ncbi:unnamed protein product [Schistosoma margrebowiei]|uniref:Uncharacterized protein n=1 Tax=Schistosoma margrebowiei TaxID=48269 RepID=A0AA85A3H5_9TREM|nr:unnamed protein product [Schistosoma margrebowiei]
MPQNKMKTPASRRSAKRRKTTQFNTTTDTTSNSFNETSHSVHPEADKRLPVVSIPDMLKTLMVNSDDNRNCNHMDAIKKLQVDMNILNPLKYLINPNLTEIPDQMNDINIFLDRVASEVFERIRRSSNAIVFNIPDTHALKKIKSSLLRASNMTHVPCVCTRLKRSHPGMHSPILFKFNSSVDASEFLNSSNSLRQKQIFKDIKTLPDKTPCQRKAGRDNYRPPASNSQTHHNPNDRKVKSDSKKTSSLTILPPPKNSSESPKVQNREKSNPDVGGVHPLKNVDLDSTRSSCADEEWDNTVQTPVSATPSYSNCATDNRKTNHNIHITDHELNVDIFEPPKPSQVCLTVHNPLQHMKKPKSITNLGNKHLKHVTHTSGINSYLNCNWPLGQNHRPDSLLGPAPNMYTMPLSDVISNSSEKTFFVIPPAFLPATVNIFHMMTKWLNLFPLATQLLP